jgi:oxygen-independent coproporphyrinogen-3 oxidase
MLEELSDRRLHPELPIFALENGNQSVVYVPGNVMPLDRQVLVKLESYWQCNAPSESDPEIARLVDELEELAREVLNAWQAQRDSEFRPECLNLHLGYACNLACGYCYARPTREAASCLPQPVNDAPIAAAAEAVAACCAQLGKSFHFVMQGLGEPTVQWETLCNTVELVRAVAARYGLEWFGHITTNGQFSKDQAVWLTKHFNSIGLSCDGPPDVQDRRRPRVDGRPSSQWVRKAAENLLRRIPNVEIRATVVPSDMLRLCELVEYVGGTLGVSSLRVEPVFGARGACFDPAMAEGLVHEYLLAERLAASMGVDLCMCSPRLEELHGPLCESARNSLRVMPDGSAVNCFLRVVGRTAREMKIGRYDLSTRSFVLNDREIRNCKDRALEIPSVCRNCFNKLHCERSCPEACPWRESESKDSFRCVFQKLLASQWIWKAACSTGLASSDRGNAIVGSASRPRALRDYLGRLPDIVDGDRIAREWRKARSRYRLEEREMPPPPWVRRGFDVTGTGAWDLLRRYAGVQTDRGVSVYIHVPFCLQHCRFCDCHSVPIRTDGGRDYVQLLIRHLQAWAEQTAVASRPVTTIHFGGGTPNSLGNGRLESILEACRRAFAISRDTELAIETTASLCTNDELFRLRQMGFTRLHVGVQTLDPGLRRELGRRTPVSELIERLQRSRAMGLTTSVDLIYGLPRQDPDMLVNTLLSLTAVGIHGVSLYHLNVSKKNKSFVRRFRDYRRDPVLDYVMLQCAEQILLSCGYQKNHFVHYALPADKNLYFRHALRDEDLMGLGASASGTFGPVVYRCRPFPAYGESGSCISHAVEGVVVATEQGREFRQAEAMMMCGELRRGLFENIDCEDLFPLWERYGLIRAASPPGRYTLTGSGSWMLSEMLCEFRVHCRRNMQS